MLAIIITEKFFGHEWLSFESLLSCMFINNNSMHVIILLTSYTKNAKPRLCTVSTMLTHIANPTVGYPDTFVQIFFPGCQIISSDK